MPCKVEILAAHEIDRSKWDDCVRHAANGLIYSRYDYLQHMCGNWYGIIAADYTSVMALPLRKKWGIRYLYQPAFIQQLGWVGETPEIDIIPLIHGMANYGDILLNFDNHTLASNLKAVYRTNLVIDLKAGYTSIHAAYKKDLLLNIKKAAKENLHIIASDNIEQAVSLYHHFYGNRMGNLDNTDYHQFQLLCKTLQRTGHCFTRKILDAAGDLLAIGLFLKDEKRIYNLMNTTTDKGRIREANHFLLDAVIREFAGQDLLFDFEGSDLPGVKNFYEKFGAVNQPFFLYHFNRLPAFIRLFKR